MMPITCCVKLYFDLTQIQSLEINLQHYQTYWCTDKCIGTNCTSLLRAYNFSILSFNKYENFHHLWLVFVGLSLTYNLCSDFVVCCALKEEKNKKKKNHEISYQFFFHIYIERKPSPVLLCTDI